MAPLLRNRLFGPWWIKERAVAEQVDLDRDLHGFVVLRRDPFQESGVRLKSQARTRVLGRGPFGALIVGTAKLCPSPVPASEKLQLDLGAAPELAEADV